MFDLNYDHEEEEAVLATLRSRWISTGPRTVEFERLFAEALGARHAVAVANCTCALHLALQIVGVREGDEVIVPSLTFVATANAVRYVRATPVFCDIRGPDDLNIDPEQIESLITEKTRAIVVMHYGGFPCDMDRILELARKHRLRVVEDACHGPLSEYRGRKLGTMGDIGCFSFFSNKNISTGEGGMLVTDDAEFAERARLLRSHGMTTLSYQRASGHSTRYDVVESGYNYRMDDIHAALGIVQLGKLRNDIARRAIVRDIISTPLRTPEGSRSPSAAVRTWYRTTSSLSFSRARTPPGETRCETRCTSAGSRRAFTTRRCIVSRVSSRTAGRCRRPSASRIAS